MDISVTAGAVATVVFASSTLPMLAKAWRTKDVSSYSAGNIVLANVGNLLYAVYVVHLPIGPIWALHAFHTLSTGLMLHWYIRYVVLVGRTSCSSMPGAWSCPSASRGNTWNMEHPGERRKGSGMAEPRTYPHGVTCWIDTEQPDVPAAGRFYGELFSWTLTDAATVGAPGPYLVAALDGQEVAAIGSASADAATWNTYVAVDDADAAAAAVTAAGGTVISAPSDVRADGRVAICVDPAGAGFRLWQAGRRLGAQVTNSPGAWNFSDLHTPDREAAMAFYTPVFGWRAVDLGQGAGTMLQVPGYGDHLAATVDPGIYERQASAPPGFADVIGALVVIGATDRARWHVTFTVADRDDRAAMAERLGATIVTSADDLWTKNAAVRDPQGAEFTISQFTPPDGDW